MIFSISLLKCFDKIFAFAAPIPKMPREFITRKHSVSRLLSIAAIILLYDFSPKPSSNIISFLCFSNLYKSAYSFIKPFDKNVSIVAMLIPSIFIQFLLTKFSKPFIFLTGQSTFSHTSVFTPSLFFIINSDLHTGHFSGSLKVLLFVKFSSTCGIIIFALNTFILSPIPSFNSSTIDTL